MQKENICRRRDAAENFNDEDTATGKKKEEERPRQKLRSFPSDEEVCNVIVRQQTFICFVFLFPRWWMVFSATNMEIVGGAPVPWDEFRLLQKVEGEGREEMLQTKVHTEYEICREV